MDILHKHFKKDHVHMRLWMRFNGMTFFLVSLGQNGRHTGFRPMRAGSGFVFSIPVFRGNNIMHTN